MKSEGTRTYTMTSRARAVAHNEKRILDAAVALWQSLPFREITLEAIAERSGITTRTILRKYGSKEGLFEAILETQVPSIEAVRDTAPVGDIRGALVILLDNYETYGDANIRTLAVEDELDIARKILERGRSYHRNWCTRVFAPYLPAPADSAYELRLLAYMTATDVYLWKLLRRDLKNSLEETLQVMHQLVTGLTLT